MASRARKREAAVAGGASDARLLLPASLLRLSVVRDPPSSSVGSRLPSPETGSTQHFL